MLLPFMDMPDGYVSVDSNIMYYGAVKIDFS